MNGLSSSAAWQSSALLDQSHAFLHRHMDWKVVYTPRNCNSAAHVLANWARTQHFFGYLPPSQIPPAVLCDRGGTVEDPTVTTFSSNG